MTKNALLKSYRKAEPTASLKLRSSPQYITRVGRSFTRDPSFVSRKLPRHHISKAFICFNTSAPLSSLSVWMCPCALKWTGSPVFVSIQIIPERRRHFPSERNSGLTRLYSTQKREKNQYKCCSAFHLRQNFKSYISVNIDFHIFIYLFCKKTKKQNQNGWKVQNVPDFRRSVSSGIEIYKTASQADMNRPSDKFPRPSQCRDREDARRRVAPSPSVRSSTSRANLDPRIKSCRAHVITEFCEFWSGSACVELNWSSPNESRPDLLFGVRTLPDQSLPEFWRWRLGLFLVSNQFHFAWSYVRRWQSGGVSGGAAARRTGG